MKFLIGVKERIKEYVMENDKKKIRDNLIIVILIGVITIVAAGSFLSNDSNQSLEEINPMDEIKAASSNVNTNDELEVNLKNILSKVEGSGKVEVMVTYIVSSEKVTAYETSNTKNETIEKDSQGGTRSSIQESGNKNLAYEGEKPVIIKEIYPQIKGVLVVAQGASNPLVRERLTKAVQVLLDLPIHRIQVYKLE